MKAAVRMVAIVLLVGLLQNTLAQLWVPLGWIDGLMMVTGFFALRLRFAPAVFTGALAGLVQDILGGGLVGLHAFSKTVIAGILGSAGNVLVVRGQLAEAMVVGIGAIAEGAIVRALLLFLDWPGLEPGGLLATRGAATALAMGTLLVVVPRLGSAWRNRGRRRRQYVR